MGRQPGAFSFDAMSEREEPPLIFGRLQTLQQMRTPTASRATASLRDENLKNSIVCQLFNEYLDKLKTSICQDYSVRRHRRFDASNVSVDNRRAGALKAAGAARVQPVMR
jgi:hypothetical protein